MKTNRKSGQRTVDALQVDEFSVKKTLALFTVEEQKKVAQNMRERYDWYGGYPNNIPVQWVLDVIHITDPSYETQFTPAI